MALICILVVHFNATVTGYFTLPHKIFTSNLPLGIYLGDFGSSLFFIVSGASLTLTVPAEQSPLQFYKKRARAVYPLFWLAWFVVFSCRFVTRPGSFGGARTVTLVLTFLGLDNFAVAAGWVGMDFACVGEWFLGSILFLYLLFPLLQRALRKNAWLTWAVTLAVCIPVHLLGWDARLVAVHIPEFLFGMTFLTLPKKAQYILVPALLVAAIPAKGWNGKITCALASMGVFILLALVSPLLDRPWPRALGAELAKISYAVFLVHHVLIQDMASFCRGQGAALAANGPARGVCQTAPQDIKPAARCFYPKTAGIFLTLYTCALCTKIGRYGIISNNVLQKGKGRSTVSEFSVSLAKLAEEANLTIAYTPCELDKIQVTATEVYRPGILLAGYYENFDNKRIQIIGLTEMSYLDELSTSLRNTHLEKLFSFQPPAVVLTRGMRPMSEMMQYAKQYGVPLLMSTEMTSALMGQLITTLNTELAPRITRHGVLVEVYGEGILILGDSGVGKGETAIELVKRGHRLIADDAVELRRVSYRKILGTAPANIRHFIELRGIGIINVARVFGIGSVRSSVEVEMVVQLEPWDRTKNYDRTGLETEYYDILGVKVPSMLIPVMPGRNLAVILETAAINNRQKEMGYNAAKELLTQLGLADDISK